MIPFRSAYVAQRSTSLDRSGLGSSTWRQPDLCRSDSDCDLASLDDVSYLGNCRPGEPDRLPGIACIQHLFADRPGRRPGQLATTGWHAKRKQRASCDRCELRTCVRFAGDSWSSACRRQPVHRPVGTGLVIAVLASMLTVLGLFFGAVPGPIVFLSLPIAIGLLRN